MVEAELVVKAASLCLLLKGVFAKKAFPLPLADFIGVVFVYVYLIFLIDGVAFLAGFIIFFGPYEDHFNFEFMAFSRNRKFHRGSRMKRGVVGEASFERFWGVAEHSLFHRLAPTYPPEVGLFHENKKTIFPQSHLLIFL